MARTTLENRKFRPMVNIRDSYYDSYRKNDPNTSIKVEVYIEIVLGFILFIMQKILSGRQVMLPANMGTMYIVGKKPKTWVDDTNDLRGLAVNWEATKEYWRNNEEARKAKKVIYHFNEHTNGYRYKFHWVKQGMTVRNKFHYYFRAMRNNKRGMTKQLKNNVDFLTI